MFIASLSFRKKMTINILHVKFTGGINLAAETPP